MADEIEMTQVYVVMLKNPCLPRAVFLDKDLAEDYITGHPEYKSTLEPSMLVKKREIK